MGQIFHGTQDWRWTPDSDEINAISNILLRGDNTIPDELGSRRLRKGSTLLHSGLAGPVHTVYTAELQGNHWRIIGADHTLYVNGEAKETDWNGTGDMCVGNDSYQAFVARGTTKKKWDGENFFNWGIAAPSGAPTLAAIDAIEYVASSFDYDESPALTIHEGASLTPVFVDSYLGPATAATGGKIFYTDGINPTAGRAITIPTAATGGIDRVYTFVATVASAGDVKIGANADATMTNLARCINKSGGVEGAGQDYMSAGGVAHALVAASINTTTDVITLTIATTGTTGNIHITNTETSISIVNPTGGQSLGVNRALSLTPAAATGRASVSKKWTTNQDFLDFMGNTGGQTDLFDMRVWLEEPKKVDKVTIMFGMSTGADPFLDDYYYFDFNIRNTGTVDVKDPASNQAAAYGISNQRLLSPLTPQEITRVKSPAEAGKVLRALGRFAGPRSRERADAQQASPAWSHMTVTRGQFNRVGGTPGAGWKTIRGFKVVYTCLPGSTSRIFLDDAIWSGGGNRALTGTFQVGIRFARKFSDKNGAEVYTELSPMSRISKAIVLQQQTLEVRIPAEVVTGKDPQVNQIWVYLYGGWLDTYYRVAVLPAETGYGMTIDEISNPNNLDDPGEWSRLTSHGFTATTNRTTDTPDIVARIYKSELEALIDNEIYEAGSVGPPDDIVAVAGPWNKRLFVLTKEGWLYPSSQKCPSSFSLYQCLDLRMYGDPLWMAKTVNGVFVGMSKDIIQIGGSGDNDEQNLLADLYPVPLGVANPPVDRSMTVDGNNIYYRSCDGPMLFTGASSQIVPFNGTALLWQGIERYGVPALDIANGRFRWAVDNHFMYLAVPEGAAPTATITYESGNATRNDRYVLGDRTYRFAVQTVTYGDVKIGATPDESYTNLQRAIMATGGTGSGKAVYDEFGTLVTSYDYYVESAHPTMTATIDTDSNTITLAGDPTSKLYLFASSKNVRASKFESPCTSLWKGYPDQWARFTYPDHTPMSLAREPDGGLLMGTYEGDVLLIEEGESDHGSAIPVEILTPYSQESPTTRKDLCDIQIHAQTGGSVGTINIFCDEKTGLITAPSKTFDFSMRAQGIYRADISDIGPVTRVQVEFTGDMTSFSIHALGITFNERPQHVMNLNLGYVIPQDNADLAWINQVEVELCSAYNVYLDFYKNGVLHATETIVAKPNVRDVYTVVPPRETKGRRIGLKLRTSRAAGEGFVGFETWMVRVRDGASGNVTELYHDTGDQRSDQ